MATVKSNQSVQLFNTIAPNIPIAPTAYQQLYFDQLTNALRLYFKSIDNFTQNIQTPPSGTTANRPTVHLVVGQFYFDTTLGYPIWYNANGSTGWVNATGTVV